MAFRSTLLLSSLNLILLFLSSVSLVPIFVLRSSPTSFGWTLFTVSFFTLLSSLIGFYSQLTHFCFVTHVSIALASLTGQVLSFLSLFLRNKTTRSLLGSQRDGKEVWILMFLLEFSFLAMALVQCFVLVLGCVVQKRWTREDAEEKSKELDEKKRGEFGKFAKNDIERC